MGVYGGMDRAGAISFRIRRVAAECPGKSMGVQAEYHDGVSGHDGGRIRTGHGHVYHRRHHRFSAVRTSRTIRVCGAPCMSSHVCVPRARQQPSAVDHDHDQDDLYGAACVRSLRWDCDCTDAIIPPRTRASRDPWRDRHTQSASGGHGHFYGAAGGHLGRDCASPLAASAASECCGRSDPADRWLRMGM